MALIICPECKKEISDKAPSCPNCGYPLELAKSAVPSEEPCIHCGYSNPIGSDYCDSCGIRLTEYTAISKQLSTSPMNIKPQIQTEQEEHLRIQNEMLMHEKHTYDNQAKCPQCNSTSLSGNKKGFGIGKAVVGAFALGPIGLVAGNIGSKKVVVTCLNCGYRFKI